MNEFEILFEALKITEPILQKEILTHGVLEKYPKGVSVVEQDKYIKWLAIVIQDSVRVWQEEEDREISLYYVNPLETCSLSLAVTFKDWRAFYDYLIYSKELSENKIHISHKELANELGNTREVISRLLKQMGEEGRLKLHFKMIELIKS